MNGTHFSVHWPAAAFLPPDQDCPPQCESFKLSSMFCSIPLSYRPADFSDLNQKYLFPFPYVGVGIISFLFLPGFVVILRLLRADSPFRPVTLALTYFFSLRPPIWSTCLRSGVLVFPSMRSPEYELFSASFSFFRHTIFPRTSPSELWHGPPLQNPDYLSRPALPFPSVTAPNLP